MLTTKKVLLLAMTLFVSASLCAQISIEKYYVGGGLGFTKLTGDIAEGGSGGLTYFLDGAAFLTPQLAVGLEGNFNLHGFKDEDDDLNFYGAGLYLAKAEYYFMDNNFSPFGGLGLGVSKISTPEVSSGGTVILPEEKRFNLAISPRVGFVAGGFHMEFIYNLAGKTPKVENVIGNAGEDTYNFWTISLGYRYMFDN